MSVILVRSMSFEDSSRGQMSSATNPEARDHGADDEAGLRIVDHARADHGADGLAGDHAAAVEGVGAAQLRHRDYVPRAHHPYLSIASLLLPNARDAAYAGAPTANPTYPTQVRRA